MTKDDIDKKAKKMIELNELFIDGKREKFTTMKNYKSTFREGYGNFGGDKEEDDNEEEYDEGDPDYYDEEYDEEDYNDRGK